MSKGFEGSVVLTQNSSGVRLAPHFTEPFTSKFTLPNSIAPFPGRLFALTRQSARISRTVLSPRRARSAKLKAQYLAAVTFLTTLTSQPCRLRTSRSWRRRTPCSKITLCPFTLCHCLVPWTGGLYNKGVSHRD